MPPKPHDEASGPARPHKHEDPTDQVGSLCLRGRLGLLRYQLSSFGEGFMAENLLGGLVFDLSRYAAPRPCQEAFGSKMPSQKANGPKSGAACYGAADSAKGPPCLRREQLL